MQGPGAAGASGASGAALNGGELVRLRAPNELWLAVRLRYVAQSGTGSREWSAEVTAYSYALYGISGAEILVYHWHPVDESRVTWPHLHVAQASGRPLTSHTHLPTGRVELADVVRLVIEEFGVPPRRADWRAVLAAAGEGG